MALNAVTAEHEGGAAKLDADAAIAIFLARGAGAPRDGTTNTLAKQYNITMKADSIMDPEVISILGESLIVFCMVFVSVVVVIKLAERSVDVAGLHVLGGHEIGGGAGHARTGNTHAAASRRNGGAPSRDPRQLIGRLRVRRRRDDPAAQHMVQCELGLLPGGVARRAASRRNGGAPSRAPR